LALVDLFHVIMRDVVRLDTKFEDHGSLSSLGQIYHRF